MIWRPRTLLALGVLVATSSQPVGLSTPGNTLYSGTVLSFGSGVPVAGVNISAVLDRGSHATTDVDGRFEILAPADSVLELDSPGHRLSRVELALYEGPALGVLALEPLATLSGRLVQDGAPLAGARVHVVERFYYYSQARSVAQTRTDKEGRFEFERLSVPRHYTYLMAVEGVGPFLEIPELPPGPIELGALRVPGSTLVSGSVVDAAAEPVADALVAFSPYGFNVVFRSKVFDLLWIHSRTGDRGQFEVTVPAGMYQVVVYAEGHAVTRRFGTQIGTASHQRLDPLQLGAPVEFGGRVTGRDGSPIPGVTVTTSVYSAGWTSGSPYPKLESTTDARGCYRISGVPPEAGVNLDFTKHGYARGHAYARTGPLNPLRAPVSPGDNATGICGTTPDQVLVKAKAKVQTSSPSTTTDDGSPDGLVDVTVITIDERGLPIPGALVHLETVDNQPLPQNSRLEADAGGRIRFRRVVPGRYRIYAKYRWGQGRAGVVTLDASHTAVSIKATRRNATGAELTGRVGDAMGGPVAGAVVRLVQEKRWSTLQTTLSDATGAFRFSEIPAGPFRVRASRPGYASATSERLSLENGPLSGIQLRLSPGATLTGQIMGLEAGIQGVTVRAYTPPPRNEALWRGWVDKKLEYYIPHVAAGEWTVQVTTGDWRLAEAVVHVAETDTVVEQAVVFPGGLEITGTVSFRDAPVPYASIDLTRRQAERGAHRRLVADARGRFSARGFPPGTYHLFIRSRVLKSPFVTDRAIHDDQPLHIEMKGSVLEVVIVDRGTGKHLPNAAIRLRPLQNLGADTYPDFPRVDDDGRFRVGPLTAGEWNIDATAPGHAKETVRVNLSNEDAPAVVIALEASPGLRLMLGRLDGEPLESAHLVWTGEGKGTLDSRVYLYGRPDFHWQDIPLGPATLQAWAYGRWLAARATIDNDGTPIALALAPAGRLILEVAALADDPTPAVLRIFAPDGQPVAGPPFVRPSLFEWTRDDDGLFRVFDLVPGEYRAVVTADDGRLWDSAITVVALETTRPVLQ